MLSSETLRETARFFEWCDSAKEISLAGHVFMNLKGLVPAVGLLLCAFSPYPLGPALLFGGIAASIPPMYAVGRPYDGFVAPMGLPHLLLTAPGTAVVCAGVASGVVSWAAAPGFFAWSCVQLAVFGVSHVLDAVSLVQWYACRNRKVARGIRHVRQWEKQGRLPLGTGNVQVLMKRGVIGDARCDEFGFLRDGGTEKSRSD